MFEVEVSVPLRFTHHLEGFGEEFSKEHRHTWDVTVTLAVPDLDQRGVGVDFVKLKTSLIKLLEPYQGKLLNDCDLPFCAQPTAEHIALWVAENMSKRYPGLLRSVTAGTSEERVRFVIDFTD
jgi:6-pyruvoyl-tetrahydropterin synthase